jgi:hypothetical protein
LPAKVAVQGEVQAQPGTVMYTGATAGTWTAGTVSYKTYSKLTVGKTAVIYEASCDFSFDGSSGNTAVKGTATVTLSAGNSKVQGGLNKVLRDGDQKVDSYGNTLSVSAAGKLKSG